MSLADPQTITVSGVTTPLPRVGDAENADDGSVYRSGDGNTELVVSHTYGKRTRRMIRVNTKKFSTDPFRPDENVERAMSCYIVFDTPEAGYSAAEALAVIQGFLTQVRATSDVMITKALGGES